MRQNVLSSLTSIFNRAAMEKEFGAKDTPKAKLAKKKDTDDGKLSDIIADVIDKE